MVEEHRGAKVGTRVAMLVSNATVATHKALLSTKHKLAMLVFHAISDEISDEVSDTVGGILTHLADEHDPQSAAYSLLNFMSTNRGQLKAIAGSGLVTQSLTWAIAQIVNNDIAPEVYNVIGSAPRMLPDAGTIATLAAGGFIGRDTAVGTIGRNGFDATWANAMIDANKSWPGASDLLDLYRRGIIDANTFIAIAAKSGIDEVTASQYLELQFQPLTPADAALAVLRGNLDQGSAAQKAHEWGVNAQDFQTLIDNTGEPIGLEQLLEAFRRGFIDEATLSKGVRESRVRNEWLNTILQLRYTPMSVADAVNAVVQDQLPFNTGDAISQQNGLEPGQFQILYNTAGEPLSRTEMEELYNRGEVTQEQVLQALRESRLKNKYGDLAFALHRRLLEPRALAAAVENGAMSHEDAIKIALEYGFDQQSAGVLVSTASNAKLRSQRERVVSAMESLYEENAISLADATAVAKNMGFTDTEAAFVFQAAEFRRQSRAVTAVINAIRSKYIGHHITEGQASGYLDALGIPSDRRDFLIGLWKVEEAANVIHLTPTQIVKAVNKQLISAEDGLARLIARGMTEEEATLLLEGA